MGLFLNFDKDYPIIRPEKEWELHNKLAWCAQRAVKLVKGLHGVRCEEL